MNCDFSRDDLWAWVHNEEDADRSSAIALHVESCGGCRRTVAQMRALVDDLRDLSGPAAAVDVPLPEQIGPYRILRRLGAGGMGVVYEAEQQTPQRRVALKVVRAGHHLDAFQAQMFRREMQTLARLNHHSIAAIYDAGVSGDGQSYYAMELVEGRNLSESLGTPGQATMPLRQRVRLFHEICEAVRHAHQRGVIHRDLKPSNIMITAAGELKVLDFGLARVVDPDGKVLTQITETGRLIGTLQYMSPEQARGDVEALDIRTDVYALGVILYETLTGQVPYDVSGKPLHEALRIICEKPPLHPRFLLNSVPRDLATVTLKALEKDPQRRYQTVDELAEDVDRYLTHRPVLARPASRPYRLAKLVQRHKVASGLLSVIFLLAIGSAVTFGVQARRISRERDVALRQERKAEAVNRVLQDMLASIDPRQSLGRAVTVREVFDRAARTVGDELADQPEIEAAVRDTMGQVYNALAAHEDAEAQLSRALDLRRQAHPGDHPDVAETLSHLAEAWYGLAKFDRAEAATREALAMRERLYGPEHPAVARSLQDLGALAWCNADVDKAEPLMQQALKMRRKLLPVDDPEIAECCSAFAQLLRELGRYDEAESLLREALRIQEKRLSPLHPDVAVAVNSLAVVLRDKNALDEAEQLYRRALDINRQVYGEDHTVVAGNLSNLGQLFVVKGDFAAARMYFEQALELDRKAAGENHPVVAMGLSNLGVVAYRNGDTEEAERWFREALRVKQAVYGDRHAEVSADLNNLGVISQASGKLERAREYFEKALAVNRSIYGDRHHTVATNLDNLGTLHHQLGEYDQAESLHREALAIRREAFGDVHLDVAQTLENLAMTLLAAQRPADALACAEECAAIREATLGPGDWSRAVARVTVAEALLDCGRPKDAEAILRECLPTLEQALGADHEQTRRAHRVLSEVGSSDGEPALRPAVMGPEEPGVPDVGRAGP